MENEQYVAVPCGKCPACKKRRASGWSFRLMQQEKQSVSAHFITLTYATENLPFTARGLKTLDIGDLQKFFKRLRKAHGPNSVPLKYYAVGEYGTNTNRPHYHIILFNAELPLIQPAWDKGAVHYGTVTGASVGYCLKYISKDNHKWYGDNDDRAPEFACMSKGLGLNYINDKTLKWHKDNLDERMFLPMLDGVKACMPRYYKDKIYDELERESIAFAAYKKNLITPGVRLTDSQIFAQFKKMHDNEKKDRHL
ncbi:replication initiator protein [Blackfly microvirus SF02]|uniref:Replication initiator protein n=1 Tax=Blackfly microvirus SF02 TaxID=2576452 RepID=A0A4P8PKG6_9VIRU|nr:replication initiator protein [Blackfly microvirus SF02]